MTNYWSQLRRFSKTSHNLVYLNRFSKRSAVWSEDNMKEDLNGKPAQLWWPLYVAAFSLGSKQHTFLPCMCMAIGQIIWCFFPENLMTNMESFIEWGIYQRVYIRVPLNQIRKKACMDPKPPFLMESVNAPRPHATALVRSSRRFVSMCPLCPSVGRTNQAENVSPCFLLATASVTMI